MTRAAPGTIRAQERHRHRGDMNGSSNNRNRHHHQQVAVLQIRYTAIISAWCWSGKSVTQLCAIEQCTPHVVVICMAIHQYVNIALITIYGNYMCKPMIEPLSPPLPPSLHDGHLCHVLIREHHRSVNRDH